VQLKKVSTQIKKFQHFYPYTAAIVGASSRNQINYMSCAWHTALSFDPPLFGILISKKRFTHRIISEAKEFTVNFIDCRRVKLSAQMGRRSGHDMDKIKEFQVKLSPSKIIKSPILEEAYVSFECKLVETRPYGDHDLFVGQVLAIHEEEKSFSEEGLLNTRKIHPLLYLGSDFYITINSHSLKHVLPD
jgi:flavin reductase (DIM6/NTAB) family NADH-FMN oxidoreductase RutF